ncbi:MAG: ABC transporter permease [Candidatus Omnitrophica bacterium]|nr:ABC transporter permease [Candidatus Omnitrophota bacterium]
MNLRRVKAIANKEFIQIMRDPRSLGLAIVIPIVLLIIFGYGLSLDIQHVPMAVWDRENSIASRDFILNFKNSKYFRIIGYYDNYRDLQELVDRGRAMMGLVIDKDFSHYLQSGQAAPVQLIIDGSDSNTANIAIGYATSVVNQYNIQLLNGFFRARQIAVPGSLNLVSRVWFNQDFQSKYFIVPGMIAVIMMVIAALLTSLTVAREWERGTMEQLISTPVRSEELIIGKFVPYFVIGMLDLVVSILMGRFLFFVPLRGNLLLLFFLSALFLVGALSLGIFISTVARSQLLASQLAILSSFLPTLLLSGFTYEIFNMPQAVQLVTYFVPARYFIKILRGIYLKNIGLGVLWPEALSLFIFTFIAVTMAIRQFKKKIA